MNKKYLCEFPNLGLELRLSPHYQLENHGFQESVIDHMNAVCVPGVFECLHLYLEKFQNGLESYREMFGEPWGGLSEFIDLTDQTIHAIFCQQNLKDSLLNNFIGGHEEMHAFVRSFLHESDAMGDYLWVGRALKDMRKKYPELADNFVSLIEKGRFETLADAGGFMACFNQGYSAEKTFKRVVDETTHPLILKRTKQAIKLI